MTVMSELGRAYRNGKSRYARLKKSEPACFVMKEQYGKKPENMLIHGDNAKVMDSLLRREGMAGRINLIYIDPPFFSKADYDAVLKVGNETIRHTVYGDNWRFGKAGYFSMLTSSLMQMKELLAKDGLIWLHLDWHAAAFARLIMDEIFGEENFVNEIVWNYKSGGSSSRHFARKHDTILVYAKSRKYAFYPLQEKSYNRQLKPYRFKGVKEYRDEVGWYTMVNMKDVWQIDMVGRTSSERTGYATQKPEELLKRIILSSTKEGDLCADFFSGSGTLAAAAAKTGRRFIACDAGPLAVETSSARLTACGADFGVYEEEGRPEKENLSLKYEVSVDEIPFSDDRMVKIELKSLRINGLSEVTGADEAVRVKEMIRERPLDFLESWSVDFDFDGKLHSPSFVSARTGKGIETVCSGILRKGKRLNIKAADIFGNSVFIEPEI